jgi:hypothetical protein
MQRSSAKFFARRDLSAVVLIAGIFGLGVFLLVRSDLIPWPMVDKAGWLFLLLGALALWDWSVTSYEIVQEQLIIRGGLSSQNVPLCNIEELHTGPSKLRLKCHRLRGSSWISLMPVDREAFLQRLRQKCPWLQTDA